MGSIPEPNSAGAIAALRPLTPYPRSAAVSIIAMSPLLMGSGNRGHASTSRTRPGSDGGILGDRIVASAIPPFERFPHPAESAFWLPTAPDCAPPACESALFPPKQGGVFAPSRGA